MRIEEIFAMLAISSSACATGKPYSEKAFAGWDMEINRSGYVRLVETKGLRFTHWVGPVDNVGQARTLVHTVLTDADQDYTCANVDQCDSGWDDRAFVSKTEINDYIRCHGLEPDDFWEQWDGPGNPDSIDVSNWVNS